MARISKIEWTEATFNPWIGCTKVTPACDNCYAEADAKRRGWAEWGKGKPRRRTSPTLWRQPIKWNQEAAEAGRRSRVFCASLADVFDAEVDPAWRADLWALIRETPHLDWLILTKRPQHLGSMLPTDWGDGWPNVCLMTSVEDQLRTARIDHLTATPAAHRALSIEPLLGPVKLAPCSLEKIDWVIVGGESGTKSRPMHAKWVRDIRGQCETAGVKFLFKQWGCWTPDEAEARKDLSNAAYFADPMITKPVLLGTMNLAQRRRFQADSNGGDWMFRTTKKRAGNLLDGERHLAHPFCKKIPKSDLVVVLSQEEGRRLHECEQIIRAGLGEFVAVGSALVEIRDSRLYRGTHKTFEAYVSAVHSLSRAHAYKLIDSAQVMQVLSSIGDIPRLPANEAQARELTRIETAEEQIAAWRMIVTDAGEAPITAKRVRELLFPEVPPVRSLKRARVGTIHVLVTKLRKAFAETGNSNEAEHLLEAIERLGASITEVSRPFSRDQEDASVINAPGMIELGLGDVDSRDLPEESGRVAAFKIA